MPDSKGTPAPLSGETLAKYTMAITVMITGVPAHKIRRFEEFGLCKPFRSDSGHRLFSDFDIQVIRRISSLEREGVNLPGVKVILTMTTVSTSRRLDINSRRK
jgi:MerR family transcriptional regulator, heat shock protein HspR